MPPYTVTDHGLKNADHVSTPTKEGDSVLELTLREAGDHLVNHFGTAERDF